MPSLLAVSLFRLRDVSTLLYTQLRIQKFKLNLSLYYLLHNYNLFKVILKETLQ